MANSTSVKPAPPPANRPESEEERGARIARETKIIAMAEADIDGGLGIDDDELEAWLDALDHDPNAPIRTPARDDPAFR